MLALTAYLLYSVPLAAYVQPELRRKKKPAMIYALVQQINRNREIDRECDLKLEYQLAQEEEYDKMFQSMLHKSNNTLNAVREHSLNTTEDLVKELQRVKTIIGTKT